MTTTESENNKNVSDSQKCLNKSNQNSPPSYNIPNFQKLKDSLSVKTCVVRERGTVANENKPAADSTNKNQPSTIHEDEDKDDFDVNKINQQLEQIEVRLRKETTERPLPKDWEKYEDDQGPYYWHVPSGTIQREVPNGDNDEELQKRQSIIYYEDDDDLESEFDANRDIISTKNNNADNLMLEHAFEDGRAPVNGFLVYALGSMPFDISQLTPELSAKALQRCIVDLGTKSDGALRVWGKTGGKRLRLRIERACLKLCDETTGHVLHLQALEGIRVWGVNANNDFAYVANENDRSNSPITCGNNDQSELNELEDQPLLRCHIFHCEQRFESDLIQLDQEGDDRKQQSNANDVNLNKLSEAEQIACLLKTEMLRYRKEQTGSDLGENWPVVDEHSSSAESTPSVDLPQDNFGRNKKTIKNSVSCAAIDRSESSASQDGGSMVRQTMIANYLGATQVNQPAGVNMLNEAIDVVLEQRNQPIVCLLHITRSLLTVENSNSAQTLFECRIRLMSFLGISQTDCRVCAFVQQRARQVFMVHVFECRPNAVHLCRAIESACKARFEACIKAQRQKCTSETDEHEPIVNQSIGTKNGGPIKRTVRNMLAKLLSK